jgi:hypothetical protein
MSTPARKHVGKGGLVGSAIGLIAVLIVLGALVLILGVKVRRLNGELADTQKQLTQSTAANAQLQDQLTKAKAATVLVQSQLDKETTLAGDLQSQVVQAKADTARVQSLADDQNAHVTDIESQLKKTKAQVSDLQNQISDDAAGSSAVLEQAKAQDADLQAQIKKANDNVERLQSWFLKERHLPVTTRFEKVEGGRSFTLHVTNLYVKPLDVSIAIAGAVNTRTQKNSIEGSATLDVETLTAGESVVISSDGYNPVTLSVQ